jgi:hypothetical protein
MVLYSACYLVVEAPMIQYSSGIGSDGDGSTNLILELGSFEDLHMLFSLQCHKIGKRLNNGE